MADNAGKPGVSGFVLQESRSNHQRPGASNASIFASRSRDAGWPRQTIRPSRPIRKAVGTPVIE